MESFVIYGSLSFWVKRTVVQKFFFSQKKKIEGMCCFSDPLQSILSFAESVNM